MPIPAVSPLRTRLSCVVPTFFTAALLCVGAAGAGAQQVLRVDTLSDTTHSTNDCSTGSGTSCSLRDAINQGNVSGGGNIVFNNGLSGTITLGSELPPTGQSFTITGPGANLITISGAGRYAILEVNSGPFFISGLTLANGSSSNGALANGSGQYGITVSQCIFLNNTSTRYQGGGGAIDATGSVTVIDSTFIGNYAAAGGADGGAILGGLVTDLTIINSTFVGNHAYRGGAIAEYEGHLKVINSTFSGNVSTYEGGAIWTIVASTTLNNNIFSGNTVSSAGGGAGVFNLEPFTTSVNSNVYWNNLASGSEDDCETCSGSGNTSANSNPFTLPVGYYGGGTETLLPLPGSAAIAAGCSSLAVDANSQPLTSDQRGFALTVGSATASCSAGTVDAGAVQTNFLTVQSNAGGLSANGAADCPGTSCTLADAVAVANSAGTDIVFASGVNSISESGLTLYSPYGVNIIGPGPAGVTVNGGYNGKVFTVTYGTTALLYGLNITGGYANGGAGVLNAGTLTLAESTVTANGMPLSSFGVGGGVFNNANCTMTILNSTISSNSATGYGGGIGNYGTMTIQDSTIGGSNQSAEYGGGVYNDGTMSILDSTISQNFAASSGGGVYNDLNSTMSIYGSTIAGNNAQGSDVTGGGIYSAGTLSLNQSTVSSNYAGGTVAVGFGGLGFNTGSAITLANTIVAGNHTNEYFADTESGYNDNGGNLVGTSNTLYSTVNPDLSQLQYNGTGATVQTMIPLPGSSAICAGLASNIPSGTTTDERGYPLHPTSGYCSASQVDVGAVQTNYTSAAFIQQPSDVAMNADMTTPAVVQVLETNTLTNTTNGVNGIPVTLTLTNGNNFLSGNTAITATVTNGSISVPGEATFSSLQVSQPEVNDTLSMTAITVVGSTQLGPITSNEFNVSGPAVSLVVTATSPSTAGSPFSVTVTAKDANGNTAQGYTGKVHFITSDTNAGIVLPPDYTFVSGDYGVHTFAGGVTLITSGSQTVTATDTSNGGITGIGTVTINAASPVAISVTAGSGQSAVVTQAFSAALAAKVTDTYGNSVPGVAVTYTAPSTGASGTFANGSNTIAGLTSATVSETFTANASNGSYSVTAQAAGVSTPATFALTNNLASTVTAASSVSVPSSALSQNVTLSATVSVSGAGPTPVNEGSVGFVVSGIGTVSATVSNGTASASLTIPANTSPGSYTITATYSGGAEYAGSSDSTHSVVVNSSNTAIAAANAAVTYSASDQTVQLNASVISTQGAVNGGSVSFTVSGSGGQIGNTVTSGTVVNGAASASFTVPGGTAAGTYTIAATYSGSGIFGASSDNFRTLTVYPAPTQLVFGTPPAVSVAAGGNAGSAITVEEMSSGNVLVATASDPITLTVNYPDGSTQVYTQAAVNGVATFNLSAVPLTEGGDYTYTASLTGLTSAVAYEGVTGSAYADPATSVGSQSSVQTVTVQRNSSFTLGSISVLTQGAVGLDFKPAGGSDDTACIVGVDYSAGQYCTVNYTFNPTAPGARNGAIVLYDNATPMANAVATVYLQGTGRGPEAVFSPSTVSVLGGGYGFGGGRQLALDGSGNVYVTDAQASTTIFEIPVGCASTACVTRVGGGFTNAQAIAVDGAGDLYVGDYDNRQVRKIPAGCTATAYNNNQCTVTTVMGGFTDPVSVAVDGKGNVYVGDWDYQQNQGYVNEIPVGCSSQSCMFRLGGGFTFPMVGGVDGNGNVYLGDINAVGEIPAGCTNSSCVISLGNEGGGFGEVFGVALDGGGNVYAADFSLNRVIMIPAGCTTANFNASLCTMTALGGGFSAPWGVATDSAGNVYVNDTGHGLAKEINRAAAAPPSSVASLSFAPTVAGSTSSDSPQTVTVQNIGNANLNFTAVSYAADFPEGSGASDCTTTTPLAPATSCTLTIDFSPMAPNVTGPSMNETVSLQDNTLNQVNVQQNVAVAGTIKPTMLVFATPPAATVGTGGNAGAAITVNEVLAGSVVDSADSTDTITLTVTYPDGTTQVYTQTEASGVATFNLSAVTLTEAGDYTYTATTNAAGVTSAAADEEVTGSTYTAPTTSVGTQSDVQTAVVPITRNFTLGSVSVVTQGVSSLDFQLAATQPTAAQGGCTAGTAYTAPTSCMVNYTFKPTAPGARYGAVVLYDNNTGDPAAASVLLLGNGVGPEAAFSPSTVSTVGPIGDFTKIAGIAVDAGGNLYVADQQQQTVWMVPPGCTSGGCVTVVGMNSSPNLQAPHAVALDGAGNVYVSDVGQRIVEEVGPGACASSACNTVLGGTGNLQNPLSLAADSKGYVYVADSVLNAVDKISPGCTTAGCVTTVGGWNSVTSVAVDGSGNVYVGDANGVQVMAPGCASTTCATTLSGGFGSPMDVKVDGVGNLYELESTANYAVVKEMPAGCSSPSCVITISNGVVPNPTAMAVDGGGNVYVAEATTIQELQRAAVAPPANASALTFAATYPGASSSDSPRQVTVQNIGNAALNIIGSVSYATDFPKAPGATDCNSSTPVPAGGTCTLSIDFSPLQASATADATALNETVSVTDNNLNASGATQQVAVGGTELLPATQLVVSAPTTATAGSQFSVTVTALDSLNDTATSYTGKVHFTSTDTGTAVSLPADYTFVAGDAGVRTFTNLATLVTAGSQTITANDAANSINGVSNAITVSGLSTPAEVMISGFTATPWVGVPATGMVAVADQFGNTVLGYSGSATVVISDPSGTVSSPVAITNGTGTFTATFQSLGAQTITPSIAGSGLTSVLDNVTVSPIPIYVVARTDDDALGPAGGNCVNQNTGQSSTGGTDNSQCTLRDAVTAADAATAGTITFDPTAFSSAQTISPTSVIHSDGANSIAYITITGPASGVTLGGGSLSAGDSLLSFGAGRVVSISGLTLQNAPGAALKIQNANVTVSNCTFTGNAGAIYSANGTVAVSGSTFSGNSSSYGGAAYLSGGSLSIQQSTLFNNSASNTGGGVFMTGGSTTLSVTDSTFSGNLSNGGGAGLWVDSGTATIKYSTFYANTANGQGGAINSAGTVTLTNVTVYQNSSYPNPGGGIVNNSGTFTLGNTLVAWNTGASSSENDAIGTFTSLGHNLIGDGSGSAGWVGSDQVGSTGGSINPLLSPLGNYGGPTQTMMPLPGSPAIAAGDISLIGSPATDQRGQPASVGGAVDIGAVESQGFTVSLSGGSPQSTTVGQYFAAPLSVQVTANNPAEPVTGGSVSFSAPGSGATASLDSPVESIGSNGAATDPAQANLTAGTYDVSAAVGGNSVQFALTNSPGRPSQANVISGNNQSATVNTAFTNPLVVSVMDSYGNLVPGASITFTALTGGAGASAVFSNSTNTITYTTDSSGQLSESITANTIAEPLYYVQVNGAGAPVYFALSNTAGSAALITATSGSGQSAAAGSQFANPLVATVTDLYGNPIPNVPVTFTAPGTGASGTFAVTGTTSAAYATNVIGQLSLGFIANTTPGSYAVTAAAGGISTPASFSLTNTPPPTYVVNTNQDDDGSSPGNCPPNPTTTGGGNCTLRDALAAINGGAFVNINFDSTVFTTANAGTANNTIKLTNGVLTIPPTTTITGAYSGSGNTLKDVVTIDAQGQSGVFQVTDAHANISITGLEITNGMVSDPTGGSRQQGGGLFNNGEIGSFTIAHSIISNNTVSSPAGGGQAWGGGITSYTDITLNDCVFSGNQATGSSAEGGAIFGVGAVNATNIIFTGNKATSDPSSGYADGGGITDQGTATITGSTFTNNQANANFALGGALYLYQPGTLTYSTISGNSVTASSSGGGAGISTQSDLTAINDTFFGNTTSELGGALEIGGNLVLYNSIVTGNSANNGNPGGYIGGIYNGGGMTAANSFIGGNASGDCGYASGCPNDGDNGNIVGASSANLAPLGNYGGPTQTIVPLPGSPTICAGSSSLIPSGVTTDQRGFSNTNMTYPGFAPSAPCVDIGAVQTNYAIAFTPTSTIGDQADGVAFSPSPTVSVSESGTPVSGVRVTIMAAAGTLSGTTTQTTAGGTATFPGLSIGQAESGDTLTATLPLTSSLGVTSQSSPFNVIFTPPSLTCPGSACPSINASQLSGPIAFTWNAGAGSSTFILTVGLSGPGSYDVYSSGWLGKSITSKTVNIPANGVRLYVRLSYLANGTWIAIDYDNFTEAGSALAPLLTSPAPNPSGPPPVLTGTPGTTTTAVPFSWNPGVGSAKFQLWMGIGGPGSYDVYRSGVLPGSTTFLTANVPNNTLLLYVRLFYLQNDIWSHNDYTFQDPGTVAPPALTCPGSACPSINPSQLSGPTAFTWNPGAGNTKFILTVGTRGIGSYDIYNSGWLGAGVASRTVNIPADAAALFVGLRYFVNGGWQSVNYTSFKEAGTPPSLTCPGSACPSINASQLSGPTTFSWNPGFGSTQFILTVGLSGPGSYELFNSGWLGTNITSRSVNIPSHGVNLFVRLSYLSSGTWTAIDYVNFTEAGTSSPPSLTGPMPNPSGPPPVLTGVPGPTSPINFSWTPGVGSVRFQLKVGIGGVGTSDVYTSAVLAGTATSVPVNVPNNGVLLYVRLLYLLNGTWSSIDYTFQEPGSSTAPTLTCPGSACPSTNPNQLSGPVQFTWDPGTGATTFILTVGTNGFGSYDIYNSGWFGRGVTSRTVNIPANGATIYVRFYYLVNGTWRYTQTTFTEQ